jgi:bacteriorhodopsin
MENFFEFSVMQYQVVSHALTYGYAVMIAAFVYFAITYTTVRKKYRISSALSLVVMVSAFLILYHQYTSWTGNFSFDPILQLFVKNPDTLFTNWYRYLNWLIDVPTLLLQLTFVVWIPAALASKARWQFVISGALMIITWYIGQFYETAENLTMFWLFFVISSVFFVHVYVVLHQVIRAGMLDDHIGASGRKILKTIWYIFLGAWMLYPIAYLMPIISMSAEWVVWRQMLFTVADITSKVIYGILLMNLATIKSKAEWFDYASDSQVD